MDELAATAGVSRATLYRLFPGKSALFAELIRAFSPWEPVADVIDAMPDGHPDDIMPAVARAIADAMHERVGVLLRVVFELLHGDPDTTEGMRRGIVRGLPDLIGYLSDQMQRGRLRPMNPVLALQLLAGPIVVQLLTQPLAETMDNVDAPPADIVDELAPAMVPGGSAMAVGD